MTPTPPLLIALASHAAFVAALRSPGRRANLKRAPAWSDAMAALDAIPELGRQRSTEAARQAYASATVEASLAIPTALRRRDDDPTALDRAVESPPFGFGRLTDLIDEAKRSLERAALDPDPIRTIGGWQTDYTRRLEVALDGMAGDHAAAASEAGRRDLIDPRFLDDDE